jgi:hypothetical protein
MPLSSHVRLLRAIGAGVVALLVVAGAAFAVQGGPRSTDTRKADASTAASADANRGVEDASQTPEASEAPEVSERPQASETPEANEDPGQGVNETPEASVSAESSDGHEADTSQSPEASERDGGGNDGGGHG